MSIKDDVIVEYKANGYDYLKLSASYADIMLKERLKFGGNISDVPLEKSEPYWISQQKLNTLYSLKQNNQLPLK